MTRRYAVLAVTIALIVPAAGLARAETHAEGHGHLYVDGRKVARIYGDWFHLPNLDPGRHEIKLSLHANDHAPWVHRGREIASTAAVRVEAKRAASNPVADVASR